MELRRTILWIGLFIVITLAGFLFLWNLGASSVSGASDEVIYVRTAQSIYHSGSWFPLRHGSPPMFEKPPLKLWLASLPLFAFGESNLTFRILDGLLGIAWVGLTIRLCVSMFGFGPAALCAALLPLGVFEIVASHHSFRTAVLDGLLSMLVLTAASFAWKDIVQRRRGLVALGSPFFGQSQTSNEANLTQSEHGDKPQRSHENRKYESLGSRSIYTVAFFCGLAVLTKSVAGFVPAFCAALAILSVESKQERLGLYLMSAWRRIMPLLLVPLVFVVYVGVLWLHGMKAVNTFLGVEILNRVFTGFSGHNTGDPLYYVRYVFLRAGAGSGLLLVAGTFGALIKARTDERFRFLLAFAYLPVFLFSLSSSKVPWYLSPYVPFMAMISVYGTMQLFEFIRPSSVRVVCALILVSVVASTFSRKIHRNLNIVTQPGERLEIDRLVEKIMTSPGPVFMVNDAISGRSSPIKGRFNVEGIYREILRPRLSPLADPSQLPDIPGAFAFIKDEDTPRLPQGWTVEAYLPSQRFTRPKAVVVARYS